MLFVQTVSQYTSYKRLHIAGIGRAKAPQIAAKRKRGGGVPTAIGRPLKRHFAEVGRSVNGLRQVSLLSETSRSQEHLSTA